MTHLNHGLKRSLPRAGNIRQHFGGTHFQGSLPRTAIPLARTKEKACLGLTCSVIAHLLNKRVGKGACSWIFTPGTLHNTQGHSEQQKDRKSILRTPQLTYFQHQQKHWVFLPPSTIVVGIIYNKCAQRFLL